MCRVTSHLGRPAAVVLKPQAGLARRPGWKARRALVGHAALLGRARCAPPGPRERFRARPVSRSWAAFEAAVAGPLAARPAWAAAHVRDRAAGPFSRRQPKCPVLF